MNGNNRSVFCAIRGPVGVLFALHQFTDYGFQRTWPVLLILFGVLKLLERTAGHPGVTP